MLHWLQGADSVHGICVIPITIYIHVVIKSKFRLVSFFVGGHLNISTLLLWVYRYIYSYIAIFTLFLS